MTLPNNYSTTTNKLAKIWEATEENKISVDLSVEKQSAIVKTLGTSKEIIFDDKILSFDTSWITPTVFDNYNFNNQTRDVYFSWDIAITGILLKDIPAVTVNLLMKFGEGDGIDINIVNFNEFLTSKIITMDSLTDARDVTKTLHYGVYIHNQFGFLDEFDKNHMQLSLNIRFKVPTNFS